MYEERRTINKLACIIVEHRRKKGVARCPLSGTKENMKIIKKKAWPEYFEKVLSGEKTYDLRLADWKIEPGDTLLLQEWDPEVQLYTGREISKKVGYVGKTKPNDIWTNVEIDKYGYQIISLLDE